MYEELWEVLQRARGEMTIDAVARLLSESYDEVETGDLIGRLAYWQNHR